MEEGTLTRIRHAIRKHLRPDLGRIPLGKIDAPIVRYWG
jgi:hypothetical protein